MQIEGIGSRILRSGNKIKGNKDRRRKDKRYIGLNNFKRS